MPKYGMIAVYYILYRERLVVPSHPGSLWPYCNYLTFIFTNFKITYLTSFPLGFQKLEGTLCRGPAEAELSHVEHCAIPRGRLGAGNR